PVLKHDRGLGPGAGGGASRRMRGGGLAERDDQGSCGHDQGRDDERQPCPPCRSGDVHGDLLFRGMPRLRSVAWESALKASPLFRLCGSKLATRYQERYCTSTVQPPKCSGVAYTA